MIIYNVTIKINHSIVTEWLSWMNQEHIPEMIATGCFTHATFLQLLETDESEGLTFAVQYHAKSKSDYNRYIENYAPVMRKKSTDRWGDQFIAFRTVMQIVQ